MEVTLHNFKEIASKIYNNKWCGSIQEFDNDLKRYILVFKMIKNHHNVGNTNYRLIVNHIITMNNVFGMAFTNAIIFLKAPNDILPQLKTLMSFTGNVTGLEKVGAVNLQNINKDKEFQKILESL